MIQAISIARTFMIQDGNKIRFRQGKREAQLEIVKNTWAVRLRGNQHAKMLTKLASVQNVEFIGSQNVYLVKIAAVATVARLKRLTMVGIAEFVTPVMLDVKTGLRQILTDELTIRFRNGLGTHRLLDLTTKFGITDARPNEFVKDQYILRLRRPCGLTTLEVADTLDSDKAVEFASPNFVVQVSR